MLAPFLGFHCSHEQHAPSALLSLGKRAAASGFSAAMCSDHFAPWLDPQGHSGFAWSWLGAALEATNLSFGTVCAPGQRYHPAVIAQAAATLGEMYERRFWLALGSGEALNEDMTGDLWPTRDERQQRLSECAQIIRALWAGQTVSHDGLVRVRRAKLYSRPSHPPLLLAAALSPETARWAAGWADGLITVAGPRETMAEVLAAFRDGGGAQKPVFLQVALSFAATDDESRQIALTHWRQAGLTRHELADLVAPAQFERATRHIDPQRVLTRVRASADVGRHRAWLEEDAAMGFARIYLHNVNPDHTRFFDRLAAVLLGSA